MSAIEDIAAERLRQINIEGWTVEHDDAHGSDEIAQAAACYADPRRKMFPNDGGEPMPVRWPWAAEWWKPSDRRRELVKAGALIVAEIERLDRAELRATKTS